MPRLHSLLVFVPLALSLAFLIPPAPAGDDPAAADVHAAVVLAFDGLGRKPEDVRVRDVAFWKHYEPRLRERGSLVGEVALPGAEDPLRPALVDRLLREPLAAVAVGADLARGRVPEPLAGVALGVPTLPELEPGEDPIPPDADVPGAVRRLAALLAHLDDVARAGCPEGETDKNLTTWLKDGVPAAEVGRARSTFDRLGGGDRRMALDLALALVEQAARACDELAGFPVDNPLHVLTARGLVVLGTPKDDVHTGDAWLLIDPGGNDAHEGNAGGTNGGGAALSVDLGGNDRYESERPFVQGSALEGIGILLDVRGDDTYRGGDFCQGSTVGGIGLLVDGGGNDTHEAKEFAQGAAAFGWGVLLARGAGDDSYTLDSLGQGLGRTAGFGVLRDGGGRDRYVARKTHESMYSQWTGGRRVHWSFAQGCGFGAYCRYEEERADGKRGLVIRELFPGGVGVIVDEAGDDVYEGSMYAQGTAYFYGLGICLDLAGDDVYTASWYGQGAAPHFAVGLLVDVAGNDRYTGMHQVQGNGRDFSTAIFLDLSGNDVYVGEDRVQGCGDLRDGYGIFVDAAGADTYDAKRKSARGWTTAVKPEEQPTREMPYADYGVFLDLGGKDTYAGKAAGADEATWIQKATGRGIGIDR